MEKPSNLDDEVRKAYLMYIAAAKWKIKDDQERYAVACKKWQDFANKYPVPMKYLAYYGIFVPETFKKFLQEFWDEKNCTSYKQFIALNAKYAGNVVRDVHRLQKKPLNKKLYKKLEKQEFDVMTKSMEKMEELRDKKKKEIEEKERREKAELRQQFVNFVKRHEFDNAKKIKIANELIAELLSKYNSEPDIKTKLKTGDELLNLMYTNLDRQQELIDQLESKLNYCGSNIK